MQFVASLAMVDFAPWDRVLRRYIAHTENTGERLAVSLAIVATTWFWIGVSVLAFVAIVSLSAAADVHMFGLLRRGAREFATYLFRGERTFFRVFRDHHTPYYARLALFGALAYWLLPLDFVSDESIFPGFVDDFVVAIFSARLFIYLCPDGVIAKHAA